MSVGQAGRRRYVPVPDHEVEALRRSLAAQTLVWTLVGAVALGCGLLLGAGSGVALLLPVSAVVCAGRALVLAMRLILLGDGRDQWYVEEPAGMARLHESSKPSPAGAGDDGKEHR